MIPHSQRCETCENYDKFFSSCKLLFYDTCIGGKKETIHPIIGHRDDWMITTLGCASHSSQQSGRDKVLDEIYKRLIVLYETIEIHGHYRSVLLDADIDCLFAELRTKGAE